MSSRSNKIGVVTAIIVGMNAMIGAGIFTAPAAMATQVGPAGILAFVFVTCAVWFIAQSFGRLAQLYPEEGSFYTYAKQWGGHTAGVLSSGAYLIGLMIAMGLLCQMAGTYLHTFIPQLSPYLLGLATLGTLVILNMFGVVLSQLGQHVLIACTVFPLIATTALCLSKASLANLQPFAPYGLGSAMKATRIAIFGFFGFECAASLFNIVEKPEKNVPKALTYSILFVGGIYTLFLASIILSTPLHFFTSATTPLSEALTVIFPNKLWIIKLIHFSILSAIVGTIHSMIWSSGALFLSLVERLKSAPFKKLRSSNLWNQNAALILIGGCITASYVTLKQPGLFFNLTAIFIVSAFLLSMITLLYQKSEWKSGNNTKTIFGIITACAILAFAVEGLVQEMAKLF